MIPVPSGVRVWLAVGRTDMRKGMNGLALQVQQGLGRDPHAGDLYVFRGAKGDLLKIVWHDGIGMSLYAKRLERGRFIWPSPADGIVAISAAQLAYMLDGIDWKQLQIAKLTRQLYGQRSERTVRLLDQMELALEELESSATEDEIVAERTVAKTTNVVAFTRKRPARQLFPEHLPRERVIEPGPTVCLCCGSPRLRKLGEDITETLEVIPRQWKVIQHVREKFTCRDCEKISQAPAPFHVIARGWAGPSLLAMILFEKYGQHQPLNRQSERYTREGVPLSLSTLADQVGGCCATLAPLLKRVERHVFAAGRWHSDDTTVPVLAKGKTDTGRCWVYVRDDRPFGGQDPPEAMFYRRIGGELTVARLFDFFD